MHDPRLIGERRGGDAGPGNHGAKVAAQSLRSYAPRQRRNDTHKAHGLDWQQPG